MKNKVKYMECIDISNAKSTLTLEKSYLLIEETDNKIKIINDCEELRWYGKSRFKKIEFSESDSKIDFMTATKESAENYKVIIPVIKQCLKALNVNGLAYEGIKIIKISKEEDNKSNLDHIIEKYVSKFLKSEIDLVGQNIKYCNFLVGNCKDKAVLITTNDEVLLFFNDNPIKCNDISTDIISGKEETVNILIDDKDFSEVMIKNNIITKEDYDTICKECELSDF